jgi:uncharacterized protein YceH (UPF0502 family)
MDHETVEEIKRHFGIVVEDVRGEVRMVAEGVEALREEMRGEFKIVRAETAREFEETRSLIRLSYSELDRRVKGLETDVADLRARLERVEERLAS